MPKKSWYSRQKFPIYEVEWDDACSESKWASLEWHKEENVAKCRTVGYLMTNEKSRIQIGQSVSHLGGVSDSITIPRGCVTKMRKIR